MSEARVQVWNATQWLARLTHSYVRRPGPDVTLRWDQAAARVVTPDLVPGMAVGLSLPTMTLQFEEGGRLVPHPLALDETSSSEVEAWLLVELLHRDIDRERFSKTLPYATGELMSGEEPKYAARGLAAELGELAAAFASASEVLARAAVLLGSDESLVVWPKTMEIGFVAPVEDRYPAGRAIRVVFSDGSAGGFRTVGEGSDTSILASDGSATPAELANRLAERVAEARRS